MQVSRIYTALISLLACVPVFGFEPVELHQRGVESWWLYQGAGGNIGVSQGSVPDFGGAERHGTVTNQAVWTGRSVTLDGTGDLVDLDQHASSFNQVNKGTWAFWFKSDDTTDASGYILGLGQAGSTANRASVSVGNLTGTINTEALLYIVTSNSTIQEFFHPALKALDTGDEIEWKDQVWHHAIITANCNNPTSNWIFVDGVRLSQVNVNTLFAPQTGNNFTRMLNASRFRFGAEHQNDPAISEFDGELADIRFIPDICYSDEDAWNIFQTERIRYED